MHDDEVAGRHQADPAGAHGPVDGRDRRPFGVHQPFERADERAGVGGLVGALLEVGAGAERRAAVGEHDGPGVLLLGSVDPLVQLGDELARQRVAVLLRVERDRRDAIHQLGPHDSSRVVSQILSHCRTVPGVHERGPAPVVSDPRVAELLHSRT